MALFSSDKDKDDAEKMAQQAKERGAAVAEPAARKAHVPPPKTAQPYHGALVDEAVATMVKLAGKTKLSEDQARELFIGLVDDQLARRIVFRNVETAKR